MTEYMSFIEVVNALAQLVAVIFVAVTVFLTRQQLKESTRQTRNLEETLRTSVYQDIIRSSRELWVAFFEDPELLNWYLESRGIQVQDISENKIRLFTALKLDYYENLYLQYIQANIDEDVWAGWRNAIRADLKDRVFQEVWMKMEQLYAPSFQEFINAILNGRYL